MKNNIELYSDERIERSVRRDEANFSKRILLISKFKTKKFMTQLKELFKDAGVYRIEFVRNTGKGKKQSSEFRAIKNEWIDQYENGGYSGDSFAGYIYIQLKPERFLKCFYSM